MAKATRHRWNFLFDLVIVDKQGINEIATQTTIGKRATLQAVTAIRQCAYLGDKWFSRTKALIASLLRFLRGRIRWWTQGWSKRFLMKKWEIPVKGEQKIPGNKTLTLTGLASLDQNYWIPCHGYAKQHYESDVACRWQPTEDGGKHHSKIRQSKRLVPTTSYSQWKDINRREEDTLWSKDCGGNASRETAFLSWTTALWWWPQPTDEDQPKVDREAVPTAQDCTRWWWRWLKEQDQQQQEGYVTAFLLSRLPCPYQVMVATMYTSIRTEYQWR